MNDIISRQAAIDAIKRYESAYSYDLNNGLILAMNAVADDVPNIDPVKHGKWVYKGARGRFPVCECSVCGNAENADWAILGDNVNYCPNCGAKMQK